MTDSRFVTASIMKKHLILLNKQVKKELTLSGISKMKKDEVKKNFDDRFRKEKDYFLPKNDSRFGDLDYKQSDYKSLMPKEKKYRGMRKKKESK
jgi:hypothetical protein